MSMDDNIKAIIVDHVNIAHLELINESHKHAGHAGDDGSGETHYKLKLTSLDFEGLSRVARQRKILSLLKAPFEQGLHAISMILKAPSETQ